MKMNQSKNNSIPDFLKFDWDCKIYALMNLAWDYVDTILDQAVQMRISELKVVSRAVRENKKIFEKALWQVLGSERMQEETKRGLVLEEFVYPIIQRFRKGINAEVESRDIEDKYKMYAVSVYEATMLVHAVLMLWSLFDERASKYGARLDRNKLVPPCFCSLVVALPSFGGDQYDPKLPMIDEFAEELAKAVNGFDMLNYIYREAIPKCYDKCRHQYDEFIKNRQFDRAQQLVNSFSYVTPYQPNMTVRYNDKIGYISEVRFGKNAPELYLNMLNKDGARSRRKILAKGGIEQVTVLFPELNY